MNVMTAPQNPNLLLCLNEGWDISENKVTAFGQQFPIVHPFSIYGKVYREEKNPELKYQCMKKMHDILWPSHYKTWHYWTERRFRTHCGDYNYVSYAGGANIGKSVDIAKIALLFWLSNPKEHAVIVSSVTLESLNARVWGYLVNFLHEMKIQIPFRFMRAQPPKVLWDPNDYQHGMFCLAVKQGDEDKAISSIIGRHPKKGIFVVIDEATDVPVSLLAALPNLASGEINFQATFIGNSNSQFDLHGMASTPKDGWASVDPMQMNQWETTQKKGICLFFSCYESPAIYEKDPVKKKALSKFLFTEEQINEKKVTYGEDSDSFYRFCLGFWKSGSTEGTVVNKEFLSEGKVKLKTEWSGVHPLQIVAGLDPAFSIGGDECILRFGILGMDIDGLIVLDFRELELLYKIQIKRSIDKSADIQIADEVIEKLAQYKVPIEYMAVDATGQGRALGEVIKLRAGALRPPLKIYSSKLGNGQVNSFDVKVISTYELWFAFREFIQNNQIRGLDPETITQLTSRLMINKSGKVSLESKHDYKRRMGGISPSLAHSPDFADAAALVLQSAIINFGFYPGQRRKQEVVQSFTHEKFAAFAREQQAREVVAKQEINRVPLMTFDGDLSDLKF